MSADRLRFATATLTAALLAALASGPPAPAQIAPGHLVVASRMPGAPATRLAQVDPAAGGIVLVGGFPADTLPPLAVAVDPIDLDLLVAVDLGAQSRILRLGLQGLRVFRQAVLADLPGRCTQLVVGYEGDVFAAVGGAAGGLFRIPRNGGTATRVLAAPRLTAMADFGLSSVLVLAQSGDAGPPVADPQLGFYDLVAGQWSLGPQVLSGFTPRGITGLIDLPTAVPRQLLSHPDGTFSLNAMFTGSNPMQVPTMPALPPGGAVAMKASGSSFDPVVLGSAAHPFLETFTVFVAPGPAPLRRVAGPLPGDPVDFAFSPDDSARMTVFGRACGSAPPMRIGFTPGGLPRIGNQAFGIALFDGAANAAALLVLGFSDQLAGPGLPLPAPLPGGCGLRVSPDAPLLHLTDSQGRAQQPMPVPALPSLVGFLFFGQWLQAPAMAVATSPPAAVFVGN